MFPYINILSDVMKYGNVTKREYSRTGLENKSLFGVNMSFFMGDALPVLQLRKIPIKSPLVELLWFIKGKGETAFLKEHNCHYWDEFESNGTVGPMYPVMLRHYPTVNGEVDQLKNLIEGLKNNPFSKRHVISYWNPGMMPDSKMSPKENVEAGNPALPPCHTLLQFYVQEGETGKRYLSMSLYQRSCDLYLGAPSNIYQYSVLLNLVAREVDMVPHVFKYMLGDAHIYENQYENVKTMLDNLEAYRKWSEMNTKPYLHIEEGVSIFDLEPEHLKVNGYSYMLDLPRVEVAV